MRLDRYLTEVKLKDTDDPYPGRRKPLRVDISEFVETLNRDCSDIIQVYKQTNKFLYRGTNDRGTFLEKAGRGTKVRIPRNTPVSFHRYLNKIFNEKFGWKVRDGISTTPKKGVANSYGNGYIFFPTNRYKFAWSPKYFDLYVQLKVLRITGYGSEKEFLAKKETTFTRAVNTYKDNNLAMAIRTGNEVMFKVSKYYLFDAAQTIENDLREALGMR